MREVLPDVGFAVEFEDDVAYEAGFERVVPQMPAGTPTASLVDAVDRRVQKLLVFNQERTVDELYQAVASVVDGEAVLLGVDGISDFNGLHSRLDLKHEGAGRNVAVDGRDASRM